MCYWFAGWWIAWSLGFASAYASLWKTQFFILWIVSIALFAFVGIVPAHSFKKTVSELSGGAEGRASREEQITQAQNDLEQWHQSWADRSRHQRQRVDELEDFIKNLREQQIEYRFLNTNLLIALLVVNLFILAAPIAVELFAAPVLNPAFQGTKA
ncbi:hypothetical protein [Rhizobium sp. CCGE 510]|uniref:hypothetical protein n=1 Tax=Rhizobium sp. CCGE 510 TaxID=1132836 RepID=UPI00027B8B6E|nr:hypothetical protein [Rhizobium sp. CCGE 510]EJT01458.1 hypothetical protein RCCGE510_29446 [Rhizobium sp. CCGE 510]